MMTAPPTLSIWKPWLEATLGVVLVTLCFHLYSLYLRENVDTLYILVVVIAATRGGPAPAVWASLLSLLCWRYVITPSGTLPAFGPYQALVSLPVFLIVAVLTGQVAAGGRRRALDARARERETAVLYELSLAVTQEIDVSQLFDVLSLRVMQVCRLTHCSFWQQSGETWERTGGSELSPSVPCPTPVMAVASGEPFQLPRGLAYPLRVEQRMLGLMLIQAAPVAGFPTDAERRVLQAVANHAALGLLRDQLTRRATEARANLEAERLKTSLLSSVSHDLRTPLSSIKACATSLATDDAPVDDETRRALLASVIKSADRLDRFVGNLLDISRLEAGAWLPIRENFPLVEIVGSVLGRFSDLQAHRIVVRFDDQLPLVNIDGLQMEQILWNLLENALKYSPAETQVELAAEVLEGVLHVEVRDHGPGIPPGQEQDIFHKFHRAHKEGGPPGLGIGLAICKAAVQAHNGQIWAANVAGGAGAVFTFTMPA